MILCATALIGTSLYNFVQGVDYQPYQSPVSKRALKAKHQSARSAQITPYLSDPLCIILYRWLVLSGQHKPSHSRFQNLVKIAIVIPTATIREGILAKSNVTSANKPFNGICASTKISRVAENWSIFIRALVSIFARPFVLGVVRDEFGIFWPSRRRQVL